jgi:hypothetical protein
MPDAIPIPEVDGTDAAPPPDDESLRRRAIPPPEPDVVPPPPDARAIPVVSRAIPVPSEVSPPIGSTEDLENRGFQSRTLGTPIPPAATPANPTPPTPGSTADLEARSLADFEHPKSAPIQTGVASLWTKAQNIHNPVLRVLGEIGAGGARALDTVGTIFGGPFVANIPGSTLNAQFKADREAKLGREEAQTEQEQAAAEEARARAASLRNPKPKNEFELWSTQNPGGTLEQFEAAMNRPAKFGAITKAYGQALLDGDMKRAAELEPRVTQFLKTTQKPPTETSAADKQANEAIAQKAAAGGFPLNNPATFQKNLDAALKAGAITKDDAAKISGYETLNATPATNLTVHVAGAEQTAAAKNDNAYYRYTDADGTHVVKGNQLPPNAEALPVKEVEGYYNEAHMSNIVQQSLNRIQDDLSAHPEIFDDPAARAILATTLEQMDRQSAGIIVAGTGGSIPLPSGLGDMINTALQNKALDKKTADAVKQYIADYKAAKDKAIVMQMEMQGGKIGRGSALAFKAITDQLPNGATADSKTALRQMRDIQETQNELSAKYPDDNSRGFTKIKPSKAGGSASNEPPRPDTVPANYVFQENGPKGKGWYKP